MTKLRCFLLLCIVFAGSRAALATTGTSAGACQVAYGGSPTYLTTFGMTSASSNLLWCPVVVGTTSGNSVTVSSAWFNYYDASSTQFLYCSPSLVYTSGSQWYGRTKYACSTGGGCNDPTSQNTGYGYLAWSGADLPQGFNAFTLYDNSNYGYYCQIPGGSTSYFFAYGVN